MTKEKAKLARQKWAVSMTLSDGTEPSWGPLALLDAYMGCDKGHLPIYIPPLDREWVEPPPVKQL